MGKPLEEYEAGGPDVGQDPKPDQREGDGLLRHLDRLAVPVGRGRSPGQVPIHPAVHLPLRLLHGAVAEKRARKCLTWTFYSISKG